MISITSAILSCLLAASSAAAAAVVPRAAVSEDCKMPAGSFNVSSFQLYPENADFDPSRCLVYFSVLYSAAVAVYDVKQKTVVRTITIKNITGPAIHASGVQYDVNNDRLAIMLNAGIAFDSRGRNISGDNNLVFYKPPKEGEKEEEPEVVNLSNFAQEGFRGFQDMEHDKEGNVFVVGSFGGSLLRVGAQDHKVEEWWVGSKPGPGEGVRGLTGLAKLPDQDGLLVTDQAESQLFRYSMSEKKTREQVNITNGDRNLTSALDGVYLPARYNGTCLLISDSDNGTLVLKSSDNWKTAELGETIPNEFLDAKPFRGYTAASVQIADRIFSVTEWFADAGFVKAGNRSDFPMLDITDKVDRSCGQSPGNKAGDAITFLDDPRVQTAQGKTPCA